jgi:hypothetical protein
MDRKSEIKNNFSFGAAPISVNGKCKISGGTIENSNKIRNGGAIYLKDNKWGCNIIINNCIFDSNKSIWGNASLWECKFARRNCFRKQKYNSN